MRKQISSLIFIFTVSIVIVSFNVFSAFTESNVKNATDINPYCLNANDKDRITYDESHNAYIYAYDGDVHYNIYSNRMIDTYLVAAALYYNFDSQFILPNAQEHELYMKAKEYFLPYKEHDFIKSFQKYTDNGDIQGDCIGILLGYYNVEEIAATHKMQKNYMNGVFKSEKEVNTFLSQLNAFYKDTKAEVFFDKNAELYLKMRNFIKSNIETMEIIRLIRETENYVGDKNKCTNSKRFYQTIVTLYRPTMASFYSITSDSKTIITSFQSPNDYSRNPERFDINILISNTIHELLHNFINDPVKNNESLIMELAALKNKENYVMDPMYQGMPWNRIVDENFVRAIQGRIYKNVFGEKRAIEEIIDPQIRYGRFVKLGDVYKELEAYEANRNQYRTIDTFIPRLIKKLFDGQADKLNVSIYSESAQQLSCQLRGSPPAESS